VISIGNIAVGGRAKTPLAALVAERLLAMGERPAILSRGYGRRDRSDGVVVVRDPRGIRADLDRAGDEPLMLARRLPGVSVLVSPSRYLAGVLAERHLGATVHILDDGFQHFDLHRDADIVVIGLDDVKGPTARTLPAGRLREPHDALDAADAFAVLDSNPPVHLPFGGDRPTWRLTRRLGDAVGLGRSAPVVAVAGIAGPGRFFESLRAAGWTIARELPFADHHQFSPADVAGMFATARAAGAAAVITTEKDWVRLLPFRPFPLPAGFAPLVLEMESVAEFDTWLRSRIANA
jgi:tetraacyldisaccharide 4'-kinase